ncbi:aspartyl protease family protein [Sphingomonas sp.]|uniref:aspartyl protease family protein n=1 Tax=Sphingomonas sp. TaxID=28214 RepID=UPI0017BC1BC0|nr:aspartyl protease family protein [Sphingomonas sp.]MBA3512399.1 aspartyl protease family protein [Sphingomonas sp.]
MRASVSWTFLVAIALAAPAAAQPATTVMDTIPGPPDIDRTTITEDIAFRNDRHDRMTIAVRVGGRGYRFLVDTGADRTAVSTAVAAELGLTSGPMAILHSVTGMTPVRTANVPHLELTSTRVRSVEAPLLERMHMGADGILGVDSLRSQRVLFDFRSRMISIVPSARRIEREDRDAIIVRGKLKRGHLIVTKAQANDVSMTVVLDTGSELTMGNPALRAKLEARGRLGEGERVEMMSVTGQLLVGEAFTLKRVEIGDVILKDLVVLFSDAPIFRSLNLEDRPAVLFGMNAMRAFDRVSIDFAKKQLRMVVPQQSSLDWAVMAQRRRALDGWSAQQ